MKTRLRNPFFIAVAVATVILGVALLVIGPQNFDDDEAAMSEVAAKVIGPLFWILLAISAVWLAVIASISLARRSHDDSTR